MPVNFFPQDLGKYWVYSANTHRCLGKNKINKNLVHRICVWNKMWTSSRQGRIGKNKKLQKYSHQIQNMDSFLFSLIYGNVHFKKKICPTKRTFNASARTAWNSSTESSSAAEMCFIFTPYILKFVARKKQKWRLISSSARPAVMILHAYLNEQVMRCTVQKQVRDNWRAQWLVNTRDVVLHIYEVIWIITEKYNVQRLTEWTVIPWTNKFHG